MPLQHTATGGTKHTYIKRTDSYAMLKLELEDLLELLHCVSKNVPTLKQYSSKL